MSMTATNVAVSRTLEGLELLIERFRQIQPPPYLDLSAGGAAYTALIQCRDALSDIQSCFVPKLTQSGRS